MGLDAELGRVKAQMGKLREATDQMSEAISEARLQEAAEAVVEGLAPQVRQYLTENLLASGLDVSGDEGGREHYLLDAVRNAKVWLGVDSDGYYIRYGLAPGLPDHVYVYGAALQYGAVHAKGLSGAGKRRLKREVKQGSGVVEARDYFTLDASQEDDIRTAFETKLTDAILGE